MGLRLKLSAVAAAGALVAISLALRSDERGGQALAPLGQASAADATAPAALDAASAHAERTAKHVAVEEGPAEAAPVDARELSAVATVEIRVTDLDGEPASGVEVLAAPWNGPLNRVGTTDAQGSYALRWRPGIGDARVLVALRARGTFLGGMRVMEVPAGTRRTLRAAIDPALLPASGRPMTGQFRLVMSAAHGLSAASAVTQIEGRAIELKFEGSDFTIDGLLLEAELEGLERELEHRRGALEVDAEQLGEGEVAFASGSSDGLAVAGQALEALFSDTITLSGTEFVSFAFVNEGGEPTAVVRGVVRDLSGLPAPSARVSARPLDVEDATPATTVTDLEGRYELRAPLGRIAVVASTGPNPGSRAEVVLVEGDERTCDLTLDRGLALFGVTRTGETPLAGAHIEATVTRGDESWLAIAVTDAEGRFVVPHCAAPSVDLDVFVPESGVPVPLATFEGVGAGLEPFTANLDAAGPERLVVDLHDGEPGAVAVGELRVYDDRGTRVARVPVHGEVGTPIDVQLPPGFWWLSATAHGPHQGALQRIELRRTPPDAPAAPPAEQALDVGPTAALGLPAPPEGTTWRVERLLPGRAPSVIAGSIAGATAEDLEVPPGTYKVLAIGAEGAIVRSIELTLKAGQRAAATAPGE